MFHELLFQGHVLSRNRSPEVRMLTPYSTTVLTLLVGGATVLLGGRYLERAWGSLEFGKFVMIVTLLPNVLAAILYVIWFAVTRADNQA